MDIDDLLNRALAHQRLKSDRQLSKFLNLPTSVISAWRTRRALPSDENIVKLAHSANAEPIEWLINLNIWRSKGLATTIYAKHLKELVKKRLDREQVKTNA